MNVKMFNREKEISLTLNEKVSKELMSIRSHGFKNAKIITKTRQTAIIIDALCKANHMKCLIDTHKFATPVIIKDVEFKVKF